MIAIPIISAVLALLLALAIFSHAYYGRTLIATVVEWYLRLTEKHYSTPELEAALQKRRKDGDSPYTLPRKYEKRRLAYMAECADTTCPRAKGRTKQPITEDDFGGMQVFCFGETNGADSAILYLHGGAYYRKPRRQHIRFMSRLSRESGVPLIAPIYKKAPNHTCSEVYELLTELYLKLSSKYDRIILVGDSSGGGLALGLACHLKASALPSPELLILLSPWVDVSLENPMIEDYIKADPIVFLDNVKLLGKAYAGELPLGDPKVSPINADLRGLCPSHIFVGTREVLYPDCALLFNKMKECGVAAKLHIARGQNHVYPVFPIPEGRAARGKISSIIRKTLSGNSKKS